MDMDVLGTALWESQRVGLIVVESGTVRAANPRAKELLGPDLDVVGGPLAPHLDPLPGCERSLAALCAGSGVDCVRAKTAAAPQGLELSAHGEGSQVVVLAPLGLTPSCAERVAHQINNALAGLVGATELLRAAGVQPHQEQLVTMLERGLQGLRELTERLSTTGQA